MHVAVLLTVKHYAPVFSHETAAGCHVIVQDWVVARSGRSAGDPPLSASPVTPTGAEFTPNERTGDKLAERGLNCWASDGALNDRPHENLGSKSRDGL